ncbi:MAG: hypothetical protein OEZ16_05590 [Chromatiales bacterium]|nr:hypothetical protein [Chromatiales bacterium]
MSHLVIKRRSVWHSRAAIAGMVVFGFLLAWGAFELGRYRAGFDVVAASDSLSELERQLDEGEQQQRTLREENAILERSTQIERQAYKQLEGTVTGLQDEILELKEELAFYRGIVSPKDSSQGLKLQDFALSKGVQEHQYDFKVVLTQVLNSGRLARGDLQLEVEGLQGGEGKSYALNQLGGTKDKDGLPFSFKYFQILEGDFVLPEEFEPIKVNLTVKPKNRADKKLTQAFDWVVGERN